MSTAPVAAPIEKTREVRLGLVMYGGVSLAIYINGVAHEMFRAVRGRGAYRFIKRLTKSDITVDVLSGTSAGGINGIFLGYALCNQVEFGACAALWRKHGDIDALLRKIDAPADEYPSLLDSEGFYQPRLVEAFAAMAANPCAETYRQPEDVTATPELDLMVTGTDFNGRLYDTIDDRGNVIQVKDHRTVFWLKHRENRKHPFDPAASPEDVPASGARARAAGDTHEALAKLARITSCFPAAFAPVTVSADGGGADARLRFWGALDGKVDRVFLDGGVLDNKPFTSTLDAIYHRTADRPVARHLLFVEPDPEQFKKDATPVVPSLVRAALDSLTRLPAYESIAADLQSLSEHNDSVERLSRISTFTEEKPLPGAVATETIESVYHHARLDGIVDGVLAELLQRPRDGASRAQLRALRQKFGETWGDPTEGKTLLATFDVDIRLRRLFALTYAPEAERLPLENPLLRTLNNQIQVLEMIRGAMQKAVALVARVPSEDPGATWAAVGNAVSRVLAVAPPEDYEAPHLRGPLLEDAARRSFKVRLDEALAGGTEAPAMPPTLLSRADAFVTDLLSALSTLPAALAPPEAVRGLQAKDAGFERRDRLLYPLEVVSGIHEKDVIHTVRISPRDAREGLADRDLERKVTGVNLGHFAAFFKRSWRSNDILWGRIDGSCELVDTLLDADRLEALSASGLWAPSVDEVRAYLPHLSGDGCAELAGALARMVDRRTVEIELPRVKRLLIAAAHREVLVEGLPQVVEDAAEQQMLWNEYAGKTVQAPVRGAAFRAGAETLDPAVVAVASAEIARGIVGEMAAERPPERLVTFFKDKYGVGEEKLDDIPRVVLLDIMARALLVVRNSLLQAVGPRADKLRGTLVYRAFLDWPLRALAGLAGGLRRSPSGQRGVIVGAVLYAVLSAFVIAKTASGYKSIDDVPTWGAALFIGLPVLLLAAAGFLISSRADDSRPVRTGRLFWWLLKAAGAVAALGVLVAMWLMPSGQLCGQLLGAPWNTTVDCTRWLQGVITAGKVVLTAGVLLTAPFTRAGTWLRRKIAGK